MKNTENSELSNSFTTWECTKCLFPGFGTLDKRSCETVLPRKELNQGIGVNPSFNKRGMKFAHVNIVTLLGHYADVAVLLEKFPIDVFAVSESRLDSTVLDNKVPVCPSGYTFYRKDRNRNGGGCVCKE